MVYFSMLFGNGHPFCKENHAIWYKGHVKILNDFEGALNKFVKVMPTDYKRVLLKRKVEALENNKKEVTHG